MDSDKVPVAVQPLHDRDPKAIGDHELVGRLGGGAAEVFLARRLNGDWAVIKRAPVGDPSGAGRARLRREVQNLSGLNAPAVVKVLASDLDGETPWFAMEYVPGTDLAQAVAARGPLAGDELNRFALGLAKALSQVHEAGVVHRDLKPANVMVGPEGQVRLIDFGTAWTAEATQLTRDGLPVGTLLWMAPEQITSGEVGAAADVHAWGLVCLFAATGQTPFASDNPVAAMYRVLNEEPEVPPQVHPPMCNLIGAALSKQPRSRPTIDDILVALTDPAAPTAPPEDSGHHPGTRIRRVTLGLAAALGVAAAASALVLWPHPTQHLGVQRAQPQTTAANAVSSPPPAPQPTVANTSREPSEPSPDATTSTASPKSAPNTWAGARSALPGYAETLGGRWSKPIRAAASTRARAAAVQITEEGLTAHLFRDGQWEKSDTDAAVGALDLRTVDLYYVDVTGQGKPDLVVKVADRESDRWGWVMLNTGEFAGFGDTQRHYPALRWSAGRLQDATDPDRWAFVYQPGAGQFTVSDVELQPGRTYWLDDSLLTVLNRQGNQVQIATSQSEGDLFCATGTLDGTTWKGFVEPMDSSTLRRRTLDLRRDDGQLVWDGEASQWLTRQDAFYQLLEWGREEPDPDYQLHACQFDSSRWSQAE